MNAETRRLLEYQLTEKRREMDAARSEVEHGEKALREAQHRLGRLLTVVTALEVDLNGSSVD